MKNIGRIFRMGKPFYIWFFISAFLIVIGAVINLTVPFFSKLIVDEIVRGLQHKGTNMSHLFLLISLSFFTSLIGIVAGSLSNRVGDHIAGSLRAFWTEKFYRKILSLPQSYHDSEVSGKIINQLTRGIFVMQGFVNTATNFIIPALLQAIFTVIFMGYYSLPIAFLTFIIFPIFIYISYLSSKKWGEYEAKKNPIEDVTRSRMQEVIANIKLVKSFTNEAQEYNTVNTNLKNINKLYAQQSKTFHFYDFIRELSLLIVFTLIMFIVFRDTYRGALTIGEMTLLLQLLVQARWPLFGMSFILARIQEAEQGSKEYFEILDLKATEEFETDKVFEKLKKTEIEFKNVSFQYETSGKVLDDVSFTIHEKERVALVGHSGVGKSTIVNLILKFYNPTGGSIMLNGKSYDTLDHHFIRENISLVFQENELFSTTIRENVAYGTANATKKDIIRALKLANAWEFVNALPKGMESQVGERGVRLSGGQKQRIQIARAILKDAPILILDEATSSLDSKSEAEVQTGLDNLMKNRLTLIIAHRFSTIQNVDTILVVDKGRIIDSGSPIELSKREGVYKDLLEYQVRGNQKLLEQFDIF